MKKQATLVAAILLIVAATSLVWADGGPDLMITSPKGEHQLSEPGVFDLEGTSEKSDKFSVKLFLGEEEYDTVPITDQTWGTSVEVEESVVLKAQLIDPDGNPRDNTDTLTIIVGGQPVPGTESEAGKSPVADASPDATEPPVAAPEAEPPPPTEEELWNRGTLNITLPHNGASINAEMVNIVGKIEGRGFYRVLVIRNGQTVSTKEIGSANEFMLEGVPIAHGKNEFLVRVMYQDEGGWRPFAQKPLAVEGITGAPAVKTVSGTSDEDGWLGGWEYLIYFLLGLVAMTVVMKFLRWLLPKASRGIRSAWLAGSNAVLGWKAKRDAEKEAKETAKAAAESQAAGGGTPKAEPDLAYTAKIANQREIYLTDAEIEISVTEGVVQFDPVMADPADRSWELVFIAEPHPPKGTFEIDRDSGSFLLDCSKITVPPPGAGHPPQHQVKVLSRKKLGRAEEATVRLGFRFTP